MFVPYTDESVRLTGRWDTSDPNVAIATAAGAYIEFAFRGRTALARFDAEANIYPLHLWLQLDGGAMCEAPIDYALRVAATDGDDNAVHTARVIFKGGVEASDRWFPPLHGRVAFLGVQYTEPAAPVPLAPDARRTIEFVGDSITEGVLIDVDYHDGFRPYSHIDQLNRGYQDDVCATYAWLTAEALGLRPYFMGYGAVGTTRAGMSGVPAAPESYPFNFDGSPVTYPPCDFVLINHGANDRGKEPSVYLEKYAELLDRVRERNPQATVIALSAFCGYAQQELGEMIETYNKKHGCNVRFINGGNWVSPEPLHPLRDGHSAIAAHLVPLLREIVG